MTAPCRCQQRDNPGRDAERAGRRDDGDGVGHATLDGSTHGALTISAGSTYTASNGTTTDILGTITDKGTIQVNGGDDANGYLNLTGADDAERRRHGVADDRNRRRRRGISKAISETLTNSDVIEGTGEIGNGSLALINGGTIDADSSAGTGP